MSSSPKSSFRMDSSSANSIVPEPSLSAKMGVGGRSGWSVETRGASQRHLQGGGAPYARIALRGLARERRRMDR